MPRLSHRTILTTVIAETVRGRVKTANRRDTVDDKLEALSEHLKQFECVAQYTNEL